MKIEEYIEKAMVDIMEARTFISTNSIPVMRFRNRVKARGDKFITIHALPNERMSNNHDKYKVILELLADTKVHADIAADDLDDIYNECSDELQQELTEAKLQAAIDAISPASGVTICGFVPLPGDDADSDYQIIRARTEIYLEYVAEPDFAAIISQSTAPTWATIRNSARKKILEENTSIAVNIPDSTVIDILTWFAVMGEAENLVDEDLGNWLAIRSSFASGKLSEDTSNGTHFAQDTFNVTIGECYTFVVELKAQERNWAIVRFGNTPFGNDGISVDLSSGNVGTVFGSPNYKVSKTGDWCRIEISKDASSTGVGAVAVTLNDSEPSGATGSSYTGILGYGFDVRNARVAELSAPPAAFDGNATYTTDSLISGDTLPETFNMAIPFKPNGWSDTGNPHDATPVFFKKGDLEVTLDASGFITAAGVTSTKKPVSDTLGVIYISKQGNNWTLQVDDETPQSNTISIDLTGNMYLGDDGTLLKPFDGASLARIWPVVLTANEITTLNTGFATNQPTQFY